LVLPLVKSTILLHAVRLLLCVSIGGGGGELLLTHWLVRRYSTYPLAAATWDILPPGQRLGENVAVAAVVIFCWAFVLYPVYRMEQLRVWNPTEGYNAIDEEGKEEEKEEEGGELKLEPLVADLEQGSI
jgi:hypothetical protein